MSDEPDAPRSIPWGTILSVVIIVGFGIACIVSKSLRDYFLDYIGWKRPHESEAGWGESFDRKKELAQFAGEWRPQTTEELGCLWTIRDDRLTRACIDKTEDLRLEIDGPGSLVLRRGTGYERYGYARIGDRLYVGPATTGMRVGGAIVLDDTQSRVVFRDGRCLSYRKILVIGGGGGREWEREPAEIQCSLSADRFAYQTVGFRMGKTAEGTHFGWIDTHVEVSGDALFTKNMREWPLYRKDEPPLDAGIDAP